MSLFHGTVVYAKETIAFNVFYVDRKTMEISVHPDSMVVIKAPVGTDFTEVRKRVVRRAGWIKRQLDYFRQFEPRTPGRSYIGGETHLSPTAELDVFDRVGGGDGFASGFFYGLMNGEAPEQAVRLGWAHGALLTTFPGDTTMATLDQVRAFASGGSARIQR